MQLKATSSLFLLQDSRQGPFAAMRWSYLRMLMSLGPHIVAPLLPVALG